MLHNDHSKAGKELQRRIQNLRAEGNDPTQPQKPDHPQSSGTSNIHPYPGVSPSTSSHRPMTDSQGTVDESFMLLGGQRVNLYLSSQVNDNALFCSQIPAMHSINSGISCKACWIISHNPWLLLQRPSVKLKLLRRLPPPAEPRYPPKGRCAGTEV